jgi:hypothetical protein
MGGYGSGRRWSSKETTAAYHQLDIRNWRREGVLEPNRRFWNVEVLPNAPAKPRGIVLSNSLGEQYGVRLAWTACNYGGSRPWFLCPAPGCGRRVAILYGSRGLACRHCFQLAYASQQESGKNRALYRAQQIRMSLGGSGSIVEPFPERPKGMHRRKYRRLYVKAAIGERAYLSAIAHSILGVGYKGRF